MKKSILVIVVLLCVASLMAAMAYSTAKVTNPASMTIVNSNEALLRMYPWNNRTGTKDNTVFIGDDGRMHFNFAAGWNGDRGFQPGSEYKWNSFFRVYNYSNDKIKFTIENDGLKYITVAQIGYLDASSNAFVYVRNGVNTGTEVTLEPGAQWTLGVKFDIPDDADREAITGNLIVKSRAVD